MVRTIGKNGNTIFTQPCWIRSSCFGYGGAYIGLANDATAASWNPAGIAQLKRSEISMVSHYILRNEDNEISSEFGEGNSDTIDELNLNYLSAAFVMPKRKQ
ncbi:MAG: hypothetical protein OMM_08105 [Candidatus Magnetoglobus multicellularis str. Araruama]|uniref:Uncharacterized protein n=1 Tax=Candidatus Magnetoglobus multicellularis str. Araruama TaxID=890399 RepID=A0A1V1P9J7_9BACT|nr:MAG: hypothetical protein OMM_08105 [Candidatus Magnetoglobus multicellularis str. Araruama]